MTEPTIKDLSVFNDSDIDSETEALAKLEKARKKKLIKSEISKLDKASDRWGTIKRKKKMQLLEKQRRDLGKLKNGKLPVDKTKSIVQRVREKKQRDETVYNVNAIKRMSTKVQLTPALEMFYDLKRNDSETKTTESTSATTSVFTEDDFAKFAREYTVQ
ncbi:hypothetical protein HDE_05239 [Halotydeus destructor]|nr:hypothetical protein HDE_05239 [Halotydeus destructor]